MTCTVGTHLSTQIGCYIVDGLIYVLRLDQIIKTQSIIALLLVRKLQIEFYCIYNYFFNGKFFANKSN
jgi:hypothetical protein